MRRCLAALPVLPVLPVLLSAVCSVHPASRDAEPVVIDLMDGYYAFAEAGRDADGMTRLTALREHVLSRDPDLTDTFLPFTHRLGPENIERADPFLERMIELEPAIRDQHALFHETLPATASATAALLDDRIYGFPVYVSVGLFSSNAQVRRVRGEPAIMFGLDALAHDDATILAGTPRDLRPLIAHEYFHAWQMTINPFMDDVAERSLPPEPSAPVWAIAWLEGLAACFSRSVAPDADIDRVLSVKGIWDDAERRLPELATQLAAVLDSTDPLVISDWFYLSSERRDIPRKTGYVIGMVAAHFVVGERGLQATARLTGDELRSTVREAVTRITVDGSRVSAAEVCAGSM